MAEEFESCPECFATFQLIAKSRMGETTVSISDCPLCKMYSCRVFRSPHVDAPLIEIVKSKQYGREDKDG